MSFANVNGVRYHYEVKGEGEPLLLLHGFTGSLASWRAHEDTLSQQHRMITIDLLGHGRTDAPEAVGRYSIENNAADVAHLVGQITSGPVNLLGYSMGARLALYLAVARPSLIKTLILESASPGLQTETERRVRVRHDEQLANEIERDGIEAFVCYWEAIPLFSSQAILTSPVRAALHEQRLQNRAVGLANSLRGMGTGAQPSLWDHLPELELPILVMTGELDQKYVQLGERMSALAPAALHEVVLEAGHMIHLEKPEMFSELVQFFLQMAATFA